jgi:hypothetical protein
MPKKWSAAFREDLGGATIGVAANVEAKADTLMDRGT